MDFNTHPQSSKIEKGLMYSPHNPPKKKTCTHPLTSKNNLKKKLYPSPLAPPIPKKEGISTHPFRT